MPANSCYSFGLATIPERRTEIPLYILVVNLQVDQVRNRFVQIAPRQTSPGRPVRTVHPAALAEIAQRRRRPAP